MKKNKYISSLFVATLCLSTFAPVIYATSVNDVQSDVSEANDNIDSNEAKVEDIQSQIDDLSSQIKEIQSDLDSKRSQLEENNTKIKKLESSISKNEDELADLEVQLEENKKMSAELLMALQKNSNVNYLLNVITSDDEDLMSKINTVNGLNKLADNSFDIVIDTLETAEKVEQTNETLKADKDSLQQEQDTLASESDELVKESQELSQKEDDLANQITNLNDATAQEKEDLLEASNLLTKYQNAGCSGNDVYGVDCAVPTPTSVTEEQESAQDSTDTSSTTSTGGSYVAKLKADPDANYIINRESGWNPYATNASSGAYGICQALPGSKMVSAGSDWATNIETQAKWCDSYVMGRYGSWSAARSFWDTNHWF